MCWILGIRSEHGEGAVGWGRSTLKRKERSKSGLCDFVSFGTAVNDVGPTLFSGYTTCEICVVVKATFQMSFSSKGTSTFKCSNCFL